MHLTISTIQWRAESMQFKSYGDWSFLIGCQAAMHLGVHIFWLAGRKLGPQGMKSVLHCGTINFRSPWLKKRHISSGTVMTSLFYWMTKYFNNFWLADQKLVFGNVSKRSRCAWQQQPYKHSLNRCGSKVMWIGVFWLFAKLPCIWWAMIVEQRPENWHGDCCKTMAGHVLHDGLMVHIALDSTVVPGQECIPKWFLAKNKGGVNGWSMQTNGVLQWRELQQHDDFHFCVSYDKIKY